MAYSDWFISDGVAIREVRGKLLMVTARGFPSLDAAIQNWEATEVARLRQDLDELGKLVDRALHRMLNALIAPKPEPTRRTDNLP